MIKRRFRSTESGAVFVPNVDEATIRLMVAAGAWIEVPAPAEPKPKTTRRRRAATDRNPG